MRYVVEFDPEDIGRLRGMTDSQGRVPWAPATVLYEPDTFLGHPLTPVEEQA